MKGITLPIYNTEGKQVEEIKLDPEVFDGTVNTNAIYQALVAYRANQRRGLASTKTRGEVSGGGRKPWRQKGTGRARVGSIRSPLWRHGGVIFGPHPRDFSYNIPNRIKKLALKSTLNAKLNENNLVVLDELKLSNYKTKQALRIFRNLNINQKKKNKFYRTLLLLDEINENFKKAIRNLDFLSFNLAKNTHVYEVLYNKKLIVTKNALKQLTERLKK
ncbi:MAG: 50S ribosomal protein L4 [Candidatus Omnitrophica bacterium]|nr:50S ribosomal protein L4 [Candidatus Omnitrophota bacterium]